MDWLVLVASGLMESVWAIALDRSDGFSNALPTVVFVVALACSMIGLGFALRTLPVGVAYAVWTGIGATVTVAFGIATGTESASLAKVLLIIALVGCIVGLRVVSE